MGKIWEHVTIFGLTHDDMKYNKSHRDEDKWDIFENYLWHAVTKLVDWLYIADKGEMRQGWNPGFWLEQNVER